MFASDGSELAFKFSSPVDPGDVWTYDLAQRELRRSTELPRGVDVCRSRDVCGTITARYAIYFKFTSLLHT